MIIAAEKAIQDPKPNPPEMLRLRGTAWEPFALSPDHAGDREADGD
jgi:hypothetical protein